MGCPEAPPRFRTGTYAFSSDKRLTVTSARDFPTSSCREKNLIRDRVSETGQADRELRLTCLGAEVLNADGFGVINVYGFDPGKNNILG
jgi:hypothetical protein